MLLFRDTDTTKVKKIAALIKWPLFQTCIFYLFAFFIYCSTAMVMLGASGVGAGISKINPRSRIAWCVDGPKAASRVSFCLKSGKFSNKDCTLDGLKNTMMS